MYNNNNDSLRDHLMDDLNQGKEGYITVPPKQNKRKKTHDIGS